MPPYPAGTCCRSSRTLVRSALNVWYWSEVDPRRRGDGLHVGDRLVDQRLRDVQAGEVDSRWVFSCPHA